jgi:hypothetical protein
MQRAKSLKVKEEGKNWLRSLNSQVSRFLFQGEIPSRRRNIVQQHTWGASLVLGTRINLGSAKNVSKHKRLTVPKSAMRQDLAFWDLGSEGEQGRPCLLGNYNCRHIYLDSSLLLYSRHVDQ